MENANKTNGKSTQFSPVTEPAPKCRTDRLISCNEMAHAQDRGSVFDHVSTDNLHLMYIRRATSIPKMNWSRLATNRLTNDTVRPNRRTEEEENSRNSFVHHWHVVVRPTAKKTTDKQTSMHACMHAETFSPFQCSQPARFKTVPAQSARHLFRPQNLSACTIGAHIYLYAVECPS